MDTMGPKTLQRLRAIKDELDCRVEEVGKALGIPDDKPMILTVLQIERQEQWEAENRQWREDVLEREKSRFNPVKFILDVCSNITGDLLTHYPQYKKK